MLRVRRIGSIVGVSNLLGLVAWCQSECPSWTVEGDQIGARCGNSVARAGDVNGDGYSDVIVGSFLFNGGLGDSGRACVYLGSATGLSTSPAWTAFGNGSIKYFGNSVARAGDVNGDGYDDVIVGAPAFGNFSDGRAYLYLGSSTGLSPVPDWSAQYDVPTAAFGEVVATAGDVNGDGFDDVIIGTKQCSNPQTEEGRARVYMGSASGLSASPAWFDEGSQSHADFGASVATAGDVNGDGYDDVIVGADEYGHGEPDEGRAYLYLGSATGLSASPAWTAESNQTGTDEAPQFGVSVATAGDVNGDGYDDVIIGARGYDDPEADEGRAYVYLGSATGLEANPAWTAESDWNFTHFGSSVSAAGDVNNDGYADVIVGAPGYAPEGGGGGRGRAYIYLGSAAGLSTSVDWMVESDNQYEALGWSVATAGDVNGDGYDEVIVGGDTWYAGEYEEGRACLFEPTRDRCSPTILAPPYVFARDPGSPGEIVFFSVAASDNIDPAPSVVCVPPSGSFFAPGATTVTCTATDASGNQATRSFSVFVGKARQR